MVTDRLPDPAHELDAALGGPPRLQNQVRQELARHRALLGHRFRRLGPALILRLVRHAVLGLQGLLLYFTKTVDASHGRHCFVTLRGLLTSGKVATGSCELREGADGDANLSGLALTEMWPHRQAEYLVVDGFSDRERSRCKTKFGITQRCADRIETPYSDY